MYYPAPLSKLYPNKNVQLNSAWKFNVKSSPGGKMEAVFCVTYIMVKPNWIKIQLINYLIYLDCTCSPL